MDNPVGSRPAARPTGKKRKAATPPPLRGHIVLHTKNLEEVRGLTAHIWSKHMSDVIGAGGYESTISRVPKNKKTVTRVASDFDFHHLGRFATAYRKKFGESPSETLNPSFL